MKERHSDQLLCLCVSASASASVSVSVCARVCVRVGIAGGVQYIEICLCVGERPVQPTQRHL